MPLYLFGGGGGGGGASIQNNFSASAAPSATDDSGAGYEAGSLWLWAAVGTMWVCRDATASAAVWTQLAAAVDEGYEDGRWFFTERVGALTNNTTFGSSLVFAPFIPRERVTVDQLAVRVNTGQASGAANLGVYAANASKNPTGTPLAYVSAALDATTSGVKSGALNASVTFEPGSLYYFAFQTNNNSIAMLAFGVSHSNLGLLRGADSVTALASAANTSYSLRLTNTFDADPTVCFPDVSASTFLETAGGSMPVVMIHVGSIP